MRRVASSRAGQAGRLVVACALVLLMADVARTSPRWTIGELPGGDIRSLAIHPDDPDQVIAGTSSGQVFRSQDGGDSWHLPGPRLPFRGWVVSDLVFDPQSPDRIWAGLRGAWGQDGLVALSTDGGASWKSQSEGLPGRQVYALAVGQEMVYAATRLGVWGTADGGDSWVHLTSEHPEIRKVSSLLIDPDEPSRIFAGTWRRAYRSDDGGATWSGVFNGMILDSEVFSLHAQPGGGGELWASTCGWVYKSANSGTSWRRYENGLAERRTPSFQILSDGGKLAGTVSGVYRSDDNGASWSLVTPEDIVALAIEHHPSRPERVFLGTEGAGVWRSDDGGRTFRQSSRGINASRIAALTTREGEVIAAVRHSGPASGVYSSFDGGETYPLGPVRLPTVVALVADEETVLAATEGGLYERQGESWSLVEEIGEQPVRQIAAGGSRVVVRAETGLFVRPEGSERFEPLAFGRGRVASLAAAGESLWISSEGGRLYRFEDGELVASATPLEKGRIHAVGNRLLMADAEELWIRPAPDAAWTELGRRVSFHPTGNPDYPLLLVGSDGIARLMGEGRLPDRVLALTVPPQHLSSALVLGRRVILGTSGYGLLLSEIGAADSESPTAIEGSAR